jgi:hypothetical protein
MDISQYFSGMPDEIKNAFQAELDSADTLWSVFVFRPSDPGGQRQNVYTSWTDLMAALDETRENGIRHLQWDLSFHDNSFDIPPGTWNFTDVKWTDTMRKGRGGLFNATQSIFAGDDVIIENLSYVEFDGSELVCTSETTVPMTFSQDWHQLWIGGCSGQMYSVSSKPLIRLGATLCPPISEEDPGGAFFLYESAIMGTTGLSTFGSVYSGYDFTTPAVDLMGRGIGLVCNWERNMFMNSCTYASGAYIEAYMTVPSFGAGSFGPLPTDDFKSGNDHNYASTLDVSLVTFNLSRYCYAAGFSTRPDLATPVNPTKWPLPNGFHVGYGSVTNCDTTDGPLDVFLPLANPNFGAQVLIVDSVGAAGVGNEIIIHARAGETINGAATYTIDTARGSVMLVSVAEGEAGIYEPLAWGEGGTYPVKNPIVGQWIIASKVV